MPRVDCEATRRAEERVCHSMVMLSSLSMVGVPYTEGRIILSLTAGPLNVSHSNGKISTLSLYASKRVTEQNVASPFPL